MTTTDAVRKTRHAARRFTSNCSGSAAIEYIVAGALIGAGVLVGVTVLNSAVTLYGRVISAFNG
jgi:Flp pilus assembly pilin Flp